LSLPTNCLRPECRKYISGNKEGKQRKWCSEQCAYWGQRHPEVRRQEPKLNFLNETSIDEVQLVTDFLVGCRSSEELALEHNTTTEYIELILRRMGVSHPDTQRTFDRPSQLLRDPTAVA
jgi:hypothetical protein